MVMQRGYLETDFSQDAPELLGAPKITMSLVFEFIPLIPVKLVSRHLPLMWIEMKQPKDAASEIGGFDHQNAALLEHAVPVAEHSHRLPARKMVDGMRREYFIDRIV